MIARKYLIPLFLLGSVAMLFGFTLEHFDEYFVYPDDANNQVKIQWTPSESSKDKVTMFIIERSRDNEKFDEWKQIAPPAVFPSEMLEVDFLPLEGWSYYRIRQAMTKGDTFSGPTIPVFMGLENLEKGRVMISEDPMMTGRKTVSLKSFNGKVYILVLRDQNGIEYLYDREVNADDNGLYIKEGAGLPQGDYTITASSQDQLLGMKIQAK